MEFITIGKISKPHGLSGYVLVHSMTYYPNRFYELDFVYLEGTFLSVLTIEDIQVHQKAFRIKFEEIKNRDNAERLRGKEIFVEQKDMIYLPKDVFFHHDLVGCEVFGKEKQKIGIVKKIIESAANDIYAVETLDKKEILIPAISQFVTLVDVQKKRVEIEEIPGLLG